jgi:hypothetical protein
MQKRPIIFVEKVGLEIGTLHWDVEPDTINLLYNAITLLRSQKYHFDGDASWFTKNHHKSELIDNGSGKLLNNESGRALYDLLGPECMEYRSIQED